MAKRCIECESVDPSRDIAPTAICVKLNHKAIVNAGAFTNCDGYIHDSWIDEGKE